MAEGVSHKKEYWMIFAALAVLTILELFIPEMEASKWTKGSLLTALAVVKAGLVGWYFMHLKEERGWLKFIALIPISAFLYYVVVTLETVFR